MADRGAHYRVEFEKCQCGFVLHAGAPDSLGERFAFSTIDEVSDWFLEQYGEAEDEDDGTKTTAMPAEAWGALHMSAISPSEGKTLVNECKPDHPFKAGVSLKHCQICGVHQLEH